VQHKASEFVSRNRPERTTERHYDSLFYDNLLLLQESSATDAVLSAEREGKLHCPDRL
jgi:hypothetical protein